MANKRYKWEPRSLMTDKRYFGLPIGEDIWKHPSNPREEAELIVAKWQHHFVARIHEANIYRDLTYDDLGDVVGLSGGTFERIMNGSRPLSLVEYVLLCKEFDFLISL